MVFWILISFVALAMAALLGLILLRAHSMAEPPAAYDLQVYRQQLRDVDKDLARGVLQAADAERIRTEAWRHEIFVEQSPMRRVGQPQDVAQAIAFLASDEAAFISGESLRVDGGWAMGRYPREAQI